MEFKDYYKILGVDADADDKAIKAAYRKLARKYHPDVSAEEDAESKFKEVSEAYEVLRDKEKRAEYDVARQYGGARGFEPPPGWQGGGAGGDYQGDFQGGFSDFFEEVFGQAGHGSRQGYSRQHFTRRGEDIELVLAIFLEDAFKGESRTISYEVPSFDDAGRLVREPRTLKVKIPAGVTEGERIRLKGQGAPGIGEAPAGDLYLHIRFAPHPLYLVEGSDLTITVPVAPWEAALGCKLTVPTLEGDINLTVPASSQNGKRMRVRGKGLGRGDKRGDLYVVLRVTMPETASEKEKALWQQLAEAARFDPRRDWG
ncbi:MAG: DnaJ domain-containing protein [Pseudomonadales bacterium]|nr:DnaJ domain-containing protein [Halieaceae bacterium]MCP5164638.1 DnaJ domain-containing protein [Pseudomonadales bacterium]MCP5190043.1 DnaJ domain-containing protein [Pseudomonadales bacterium]